MADSSLTTYRLPKFEKYQDTTKAERGLASWSFRIDGVESLYWCPTEHAVNRVILRLIEGRSKEAFGGMGAVSLTGNGEDKEIQTKGRKGRGKVYQDGEVTTEIVVMKSGREKPRVKMPAFRFEVDGVAYEHVGTTEKEAKTACAITAFSTRGKLNPAKHQRAAIEFKERYKQDCKVHIIDRKVVIKAADQSLWLVGFEPDGEIRFKMIRSAA